MHDELDSLDRIEILESNKSWLVPAPLPRDWGRSFMVLAS